MGRILGTFNISANYEVGIRKPFDARSVVSDFNDLTTLSNWVNENNQSIAYNGMLVAVANTADQTSNGIYYFFDPAYNALKGGDTTNENNWHKLCEIAQLDSIEDRIEALEKNPGITQEMVDELKTYFVTIETYNSDKAIIDASIEALKVSNINTNNAINALISDDTNKSIRDIAKDEIKSQLTDSSYDSLSALATQVIDNKAAIAALKEGSINMEQIEALLTKAPASIIIDDSEEIITDGRKLRLNQVDISKLYNPNNITLILHGGQASEEIN